MRLAAVLLAALAAGCAAGSQVSHLRYRVGVDVPKTREALACKRECLSLYGPCRNYRVGGHAVTPEAGEFSAQFGCPGVVSDCLLTCPGAAVVGEGPGYVTEYTPDNQNITKPGLRGSKERLVFCKFHPSRCAEDERHRALWFCRREPTACTTDPGAADHRTPGPAPAPRPEVPAEPESPAAENEGPGTDPGVLLLDSDPGIRGPI